VRISAKWSDLNITTRKGEGEGRAALRREGKVIAIDAACAVAAMTSLLLLVIMYIHRNTHETTDRMTNLLISSNVHYTHLGRDNKNQRTSTATGPQIQQLQTSLESAIYHQHTEKKIDEYQVSENKFAIMITMPSSYYNLRWKTYNKTSDYKIHAKYNRKCNTKKSNPNESE